MNPSSTPFQDLGLSAPLLRALREENYELPTPIQAQSVPHVLAGRDLLGCAQTGTGKTAAFALPLLQRIDERRAPAVPGAPRILVLSPTRELASQIGASFETYGRHIHFRQVVIYGGVGQVPQVKALRRGVHVVVATPGRLCDLMGQGHLRLDRLEVLVVDEADRMLDMGFLPDLRRIVAALPAERQSLFFTATLPASIAELAGGLLRDPVRVEVAPPSTTVDRIEQRVMHVDMINKRSLLRELLAKPEARRVLVFARTKRGANDLAERLSESGVMAGAIHGNKSQAAREKALAGFRNGRLRVLVATDVAARGIDVDGVTHVINYDVPFEAESYVHRIGRTGRAGADGIAITLCDRSETGSLRAIERLIRRAIAVDASHAFHREPGAHSASRGRSDGPPRRAGAPRRPGPSRRPVASQRPQGEQRPHGEHRPAVTQEGGSVQHSGAPRRPGPAPRPTGSGQRPAGSQHATGSQRPPRRRKPAGA